MIDIFKRALLFLLIGWLVLFLTIVWFVDFDPQMRSIMQISDYLMTFHVAGSLMAHSQLNLLYPPADAIGFAKMPFDVAAHHLLPNMPVSSVAEFMYMPLAAAVFVPFSYLSLSWSFFAWQLLSLAVLFLSCQLVWLSVRSEIKDGTDDAAALSPEAKDGLEDAPNLSSEGKDKSDDLPNTNLASNEKSQDKLVVNPITRCLSALFLIPVCLTIWIGQVGCVFGMLPLAAGYYFLSKNRAFFAGLVWSLAILKPQFLVPVGVVVFATLVQRKFRALLGLVVGLSLLAIVVVTGFSPNLNMEWLNCLRISDIVYSDPKSGIATHLATSLPRTIILLLAGSGLPLVKPIVYVCAGMLLLAALVSVWMSKNIFVSNQARLNLALLTGILVTPLVMPHFFLYDYCLYALAFPAIFYAQWPRALSSSLRKLSIAMFVVINSYSIIVVAAHKFAFPLVFMLLMLGMFFYLLLLTNKAARAQEPRIK